MWKSAFGDCDDSPSKEFLLGHRDESELAKYFQLAFAKRPAEELRDLSKTRTRSSTLPTVLNTPPRDKLRATLDRWMTDKGSRATSDDDPWDRYHTSALPDLRATNSDLGALALTLQGFALA
jgi:hypothetical protein